MATDTEEEWWRVTANIRAVHDYAHMAGLLYRPTDGLVNIAVTLQPTKFPQELFKLVSEIQPDLNSLVDAVSRDVQFLTESLKK